MQRYKLTLEYDGTHFNGWQKQPGLPTVQGVLESAIHAFTHEAVEVYGSGRTDAGVHALAQVAHTAFEKDMDTHAIREAINFYTRDKGVVALKVEKVDPEFHARFSAIMRSYIYKVIVRDTPLMIDKNRLWRIYTPLELASMQEAASLLVGVHDFTSFRSSDCQAKSPVKSMESARVEQEGNRFTFHFTAKSFLHHQVRNMTGALKMVGEDKWSVEDFKRAFEAKDRNKGGVMAPAEGLYLSQIDYD